MNSTKFFQANRSQPLDFIIDENTSIFNRSLTDDRPHRDIFSNQYKDFEKINIKRTQSDNQGGAEDTEAVPEFNILESNFWADPNKEGSTL